MGKHLAVKIGVWFMVIFIMVTVFGWAHFKDMDRLRLEAKLIENRNHQSHYLHNLEVDVNRSIDPVRQFLITGDDRLEKYFSEFHAVLVSAVKDYEKSYQSNDLAGVLAELEQMKILSHEIFKLPSVVGNMEGTIILLKVNEKIQSSINQLSKRHKAMDIQVNDSMRMMAGVRKGMDDENLALMIALLATLLLLTYFIYSQVVLPLIRMRKVVQQVGEGDLTMQCPVTSRDEIGELGRAFNAMGHALQERDEKLNHARSLAAYQDKTNALGLMAGGIAHEIGNPLSAISVSLQVAKKKLGDDDYQAVHKQIQTAFKETQRMETIIQVILNFGRQESGNNMVLFCVQPVIDNAIYLAQMSPGKKAVLVRAKFSKSLPKVYADEGMLLQVFINLILNAIDACKGKGDVTLHAFEGRQGLVIEVKDTGCGIAADIMGDIFSPHFTSKARGEGTGLGLAISRELIHSMKGSLELVSSDATGSCFQIWLPIKESA